MLMNDNVRKAAEALTAKYEGLALKDVQSLDPHTITGLGSASTCLLCKSVGIERLSDSSTAEKCKACIYKAYTGCVEGEHQATYYAIKGAKTPIDLLQAYYNRAQHIRNILKVANEEEKKSGFDLRQLTEDTSMYVFTESNAEAAGFMDNNFMQIRQNGRYANKAFYLDSHYNWKLEKDEQNLLCLVPIKNEVSAT